MMPVPSGLVNTSRSPGRAAALVATRRGSIKPVTAKPALISFSLMLWPPMTGTPASAILSSPPRRICRRTSSGSLPRGKSHDRKRRDGPPAHRVDVAQRIGGGDLSEDVGVVDRRREDVDGLHQGRPLVQQVDPGVVAGRHADQDPRVGRRGQPGEDPLQGGLIDFRRAAGTLRPARSGGRRLAPRRLFARAGTEVLFEQEIAGAGLSRIADAMSQLHRSLHDAAAFFEILHHEQSFRVDNRRNPRFILAIGHVHAPIVA